MFIWDTPSGRWMRIGATDAEKGGGEEVGKGDDSGGRKRPDETREGELSGSGGREADGGGWGSGDEKVVTDRKERSCKEKGSERNKEHRGLKT